MIGSVHADSNVDVGMNRRHLKRSDADGKCLIHSYIRIFEGEDGFGDDPNKAMVENAGSYYHWLLQQRGPNGWYRFCVRERDFLEGHRMIVASSDR